MSSEVSRCFLVFPDPPLNQIEDEVVSGSRDRYRLDETLPQIIGHFEKEGHYVARWPCLLCFAFRL